MDLKFLKIIRDRKEISVRYDSATQAIWVYMKPSDCPCLNQVIIQEYYDLQQEIKEYFHQHDNQPQTSVKFLVLASQIPGIYGYGGNIIEMIETVKTRKKEKVERCASLAIRIMYNHVTNLQLPLQTITLIAGKAFGGGFEMALPFNAIIAEEQSEFSLQQMRFNFLPGSGIYSVLARKVGMQKADEIIMNMKTYTAQEMHDLGMVTQVAKQGEGKKIVDQYMRKYLRSFNALQALHAAKMRYRPLELEELEDMAKIWVDSLMGMEEKDIKMMEKVAQKQKESLYNIPYLIRAKQDRRMGLWDETFPLVDSEGNIVEEDRRHRPDPRKQNG